MPSSSVQFIIKADRSAEVYQAIHRAIVDAVRETAKAAKADGQAQSPVDTGYMQSSFYVDAEDFTDYAENVLTAPAGAELLPAEHHEKDTQAVIGIAASYGIYLELGTEKAPAQPSLAPAVEAARDTLLEKLSQIGEKVK